MFLNAVEKIKLNKRKEMEHMIQRPHSPFTPVHPPTARLPGDASLQVQQKTLRSSIEGHHAKCYLHKVHLKQTAQLHRKYPDEDSSAHLQHLFSF